eukprot:gene4723-6033_t
MKYPVLRDAAVADTVRAAPFNERGVGIHALPEVLTRAALILCVPIMLAYGCAGLVYGELPMLTPFGFVEMPGACA